MSATIENRVVSMEFDNDKFEKGIEKTLASLEKLNETIEKSSVSTSKSFGQIVKSIGSVSFEGMSKAITGIADKFTLMGRVGVQVLDMVASKMISVAKSVPKFINELTFAQAEAGWVKYGEKSQYVQTIFNAVKDGYESEAAAMNDVNAKLDKLMWYTDETSYNFIDLVSTMGKFTAQGVDLETATTAMEGISNWAASAGKSAQEATRATYNLAQALGSGAMKLQDWKSIINVNMDTKQFKEAAMEAAVAVGTLTKNSEGLYKTLKGTTVNVKNFADTLHEGWFASEAMLDVLSEYAKATDVLYDLSDATGATAYDMLQLIDAAKEGSLTYDMLDSAMHNSSISIDEFADSIVALTDDEYKFSIEAFKMGQEVRTFGDAISAVKDAISTGWSETFEQLFGGYEQAKELWSGLYDMLDNVFAASGRARNDILKSANTNGWDALVANVEKYGGSVEDFERALKNVAREHGITITRWISEDGSLAETFKRNWVNEGIVVEAFDKMNGYIAHDAEGKVKSANVTLDEFTDLAHRIWDGEFGQGNLAVSQALEELGYDGDRIIALSNNLRAGYGVSEKSLEGIKTVTEEASSAFADYVEKIKSGDASVSEMVSHINDISAYDVFSEGLFNIMDTISAAADNIRDAWNKIIPQPTADQIRELAVRFYELTDKVKTFVTTSETLQSALEGVFAIVKFVIDVIQAALIILRPIGEILKFIGEIVLDLFSGIGKISDGFRDITENGKPLLDVLSAASDALVNLIKYLEDLARPLISAFGEKVINSIVTPISKIVPKIHDFASALKGSSEEGEEAGSAIDKIKKAYTSLAGKVLDKVSEKSKSANEDVKESAEAAAEGIANASDAASQSTENATGQVSASALAFQKFTESVSAFADSVFSPITKVFGRLKQDTTAFIKGEMTLKDMLTGWGDSLKNKFSSWGDSLFGTKNLDGQESKIKTFFTDVKDKFQTFMAPDENGKRFTGITTFFTEIKDSIKEFFNDSEIKNFSLGDWILEKIRGLRSAIQNSLPDVKAASTQIFTWFRTFLEELGGLAGDLGSVVWEVAKSGAAVVGDMIGDAIDNVLQNGVGLKEKLTSFWSSLWSGVTNDGSRFGVKNLGIFKPVEDLSNNADELLSGSVKTGIGDAISGFFDYITQSINDKKEQVSASFHGAIAAIEGVLTTASEEFSNLMDFLFGENGLLTAKLSAFIDGVVEQFHKIAPVIANIGAIFGEFSLVGWIRSFTKINNSFAGIADSIKEFPKSITGGITKTFEGLKEALGGVKTAFLDIGDAFKDFSKYFGEGFKTLSKGASKAMKKIGRGIELKLMAQALLEFAVAIGVFAAEIYLLRNVKPEEMIQGLANVVMAMAPLLGGIALFAKSMEGLSAEKGRMLEAGAFLAIFTAVTMVLIRVTKKLSDEPWGKYVDGMAKMFLLMTTLWAVLALMKWTNVYENVSAKFGIVMLAMAAAVGLLANVVRKVSESCSPDDNTKLWIAVGIVSVLGVLLAGMMALSRLGTASSVNSGFVKLGIQALLMAESLSIVAGAVRKILNSGATEDQIKQAGRTMALLTAMFTAFSVLMSALTNLSINKSVSLILMAESIALLLKSVKKMLNLVDDSSAREVFVVEALLGALMLMFGAYASLIDVCNINLKKAAGLILAVGSVYLLVGALKKFQNADISTETVLKCGGIILAIAGGVALVGLGMKLLAAGLKAMVVPLLSISGVILVMGVVAGIIAGIGALAMSVVAWGIDKLAASVSKTKIQGLVDGFQVLKDNKDIIKEGGKSLNTLFGKSFWAGLKAGITEGIGGFDAMQSALVTLNNMLTRIKYSIVPKLTELPSYKDVIDNGIDVIHQLLSAENKGAWKSLIPGKLGAYGDMTTAVSSLSSVIGMLTDDVITKLTKLPESEKEMLAGVDVVNSLIGEETEGAQTAWKANKKDQFSDMKAAGEGLAGFITALSSDVIDALIALPNKEQSMTDGIRVVNNLIGEESAGADTAWKANKHDNFDSMKAAGEGLAGFLKALDEEAIANLTAIQKEQDNVTAGIGVVAKILSEESYAAQAAGKGNTWGDFSAMQSAGEGLAGFLAYIPEIIAGFDAINTDEQDVYESKMELISTIFDEIMWGSIKTAISNFATNNLGGDLASAADGLISFCGKATDLFPKLKELNELGVTSDDISNSMDKIKEVLSLGDETGFINQITGLVRAIKGDTESQNYDKINDIGVAFETFQTYVPAIVDCVTKLASLGEDTATKAATAVDRLFGDNSGFWARLTGRNNSNNFFEVIQSFQGLDVSGVNNIATVFKALSDASIGIQGFASLDDGAVDKVLDIIGKLFSGELAGTDESIAKGQEAYAERGKAFIEAFATAITDSSQLVTDAVDTIISSALTEAETYTSTTTPSWTSVGEEAGEGYKNGILSKVSEIASTAAEMVKSAILAAQEAQRSGSPSKIFRSLGDYAGQGYALGFKDETANVTAQATNMVDGAVKVAQTTSQLIQNALDSDFVPTITPVIDTSGISSGLSTIGSMTAGMRGVTLASSISGRMNAIQNTQPTPQVVTLDTKSLASIIQQNNSDINANVTVNYTGTLAQLATILQPSIQVETNRRGMSVIKGVAR